MLRLFSSIRQGLVNKGQTSKYFRYAFGEVVLIVVGILIALQINNWNEGRKLEGDRQELINALKVDFEENLRSLDRSIKAADRRKDDMEQFLIDIFDETKEMDPVEFRQSSLRFFSPGAFTARLRAYRQATSSGFIQFLRNDDLSEMLHTFDSVNARLQDLEELQNSAFFNSGFAELRGRLGSMRLLQKTDVPSQEPFKYSNKELRSILQQNENYSIYENRFTLHESKRRRLVELKDRAVEILTALEALD